MKLFYYFIFMAGIFIMPCASSFADDSSVIQLTIRDHLFVPDEVIIPANTKVKLLITNADDTPEEFESYELNREKVIAGKSKTVIFIGPLAEGRYPFFGEFNPTTAQGVVIVKPSTY